MKDRRKVLLTLLLGFLIFLLVSLYIATRPPAEFAANTNGPSIEINVIAGDSGSAIGRKLEAQGVILKSSTFYDLARRDPQAGRIAPGIHRIDTHITSKKALEQLLDFARKVGIIRVIEGSTKSDVITLLRKNSITGDLGRIEVPLKNPRNSIEGELFPASYAFAPGTSTNSAISQMLKTFAEQAAKVGLSGGYKTLTPYEVLIVASLVQIEGDESDFAQVARVIYNRLAIGMPLQLNSTVQYANNSRGRIGLSAVATKFQSPYNTYLHTGLPPTPISNPGEGAIVAALHPAVTDALYFITVKPHDTRFTKNYEEFQGWVTLFNQNLAKGAFN